VSHEAARWVIDRAADYIQRRGWNRYEWFGMLDGASIDGAIHLYAGSVDVERDALKLVGQECGEQPWRWNDRAERTKDEVLALLRRVAAHEESVGAA
jgi:hypothetical protein